MIPPKGNDQAGEDSESDVPGGLPPADAMFEQIFEWNEEELRAAAVEASSEAPDPDREENVLSAGLRFFKNMRDMRDK